MLTKLFALHKTTPSLRSGWLLFSIFFSQTLMTCLRLLSLFFGGNGYPLCIWCSQVRLHHIFKIFFGTKFNIFLNELSPNAWRRICNRIKRDIDFEENITPIRFRTTVLTDIYEQTKDIKQAQAAAGHTTSAMTLKHYVKGRGTATTTATAIDSVYGGIAV